MTKTTNLFLFVATVAILFASPLASGNAFAADKDKKDDKKELNPFIALWNAITDLQNQINHIQLTPGPQGPKGDTGATGPQGGSCHVQVSVNSGTVITCDDGSSAVIIPPTTAPAAPPEGK